MAADAMLLEILTPEKVLFSGEVGYVLLPGEKAPFVVLHNHAPIISVLADGPLVWRSGEEESAVEVSGGFAEVADNKITVCVELCK